LCGAERLSDAFSSRKTAAIFLVLGWFVPSRVQDFKFKLLSASAFKTSSSTDRLDAALMLQIDNRYIQLLFLVTFGRRGTAFVEPMSEGTK